MKLTIANYTTADLARDAHRFRTEDQMEWWLWSGFDIVDMVKRPEFDIGAARAAYSENGYLLSVWGATQVPLEPFIGWVWLIATPEALPVARYMHRHLPGEFDLIKARYMMLKTSSWVGNEAHARWLDWLGFVKGQRHVLPNGAIFQDYSIKGTL